jgi:hypothetical protein
LSFRAQREIFSIARIVIIFHCLELIVISKNVLRLLIGGALVAGSVLSHSATAAMLITEVDAAGSGASYGADWFELTNTGNTAVDISG